MGQIVSVDVKHKLSVEDAKERVQTGIEMLKHKFNEHLASVQTVWTDTHADISMTVIGHHVQGALDFLPGCVRVSVELPWLLAMFAGKAKDYLTRHTEEMLQLPPPKP